MQGDVEMQKDCWSLFLPSHQLVSLTWDVSVAPGALSVCSSGYGRAYCMHKTSSRNSSELLTPEPIAVFVVSRMFCFIQRYSVFLQSSYSYISYKVIHTHTHTHVYTHTNTKWSASCWYDYVIAVWDQVTPLNRNWTVYRTLEFTAPAMQWQLSLTMAMS